MLVDHPLALPSRLIRLIVWLFFALVFFWGAIQAPDWFQLKKIIVKAKQTEVPVLLGRHELAARDAALKHISVQALAAESQWQLKNISRDKKLVLISKQAGEQRARQWQLQEDAAFTINDVFMVVEKLEAGSLSLKQIYRNGQSVLWHYSDDRLWRENQLLPECPDSHFKSRLVSWWNRLPQLDLKINRPLSLGGNVICGRFLGLANLPIDVLRIVATPQGFDLLPGTALNELTVQVFIAKQQADLLPAWQQHQMAEFDTLQGLALYPQTGDLLIAGHSFFRLQQNIDQLVLKPISRSQRRLFDSSVRGIYWEQVSQISDFSHFPVRQSLLVLLVVAVSGIFFLIMPVRRLGATGNRKQRLLSLLYVLFASLGFLTWRYANQMPVVWSLTLVWLGVGSWLLVSWYSRRSSDVLILLALLLGLGLMVQFQLGVGAAESHWISYMTKTAGLSAFFLWLMRGLFVYRAQFKRQFLGLKVGTVSVLYWVVLALSVLALSVQWVLGSEGGVGGMQPVEFAKLMMIFFAAYCLAHFRRRQTWSLAEWRRKIIWIAAVPVLWGFTLVAFALVMLRDFSPLVLMLVWFFGLAFAYQSTESKPWGLVVLLGLVVVFVITAYGIHENPDTVSFLAQSDRISTWAQPELYPHSGYQVSRAIDAIVQGGWLGIGSIYSVTPVLTDVTSIPAIQDDFAPSLFIHHFGILAAVGLLCLQLLLLICLCAIATQCYRVFVVQGKGDHQKMLFGWFMFYFVSGGVAMLAGHFIISWSTNTALLPVMGQPVPFISAAGSHLLFFVFPLIFISLWVDEESVDA